MDYKQDCGLCKLLHPARERPHADCGAVPGRVLAAAHGRVSEVPGASGLPTALCSAPACLAVPLGPSRPPPSGAVCLRASSPRKLADAAEM